MSYGGYVIATQVCQELEQTGKIDSLLSCLSGLKDSEQGQAELTKGNFNGALIKINNAINYFEKIPEAKYLLGICYADKSAAFGGLKDYKNVVKWSQEAINIVSDKPKLIYTQGTAYMNLGNATSQLGNSTLAIKYLSKALEILEKTSGGEKYIPLIKNNLEILREELESKITKDKSSENTFANKELKIIFKRLNPPTFAFVMDIASKRKKSIPLSNLQERYVAIIQRIFHLSKECLSLLPKDHDWFFVFELINQFSIGLADNIEGYNIIDHNRNLRFLVYLYNCCANVHPWRPRKNRFLNLLLNSGGWEERIRRLIYERPLQEPQIRLKLDEIMREIEKLVAFVNDLKICL